MANRPKAIPLWKAKHMVPASFNGASFHIEVDSRASGRRIALHEFPKRDKPYAEDMGRKARRFSVGAYIIGPDYTTARDTLIVELEREGPGYLILNTGLIGTVDDTGHRVAVDGYSVTERRDQGGYCTFEITFVEAGQDLWEQRKQNSPAAVNNSVDNAVGGTIGQSGDSGVLNTINDYYATSGFTGGATTPSGPTVSNTIFDQFNWGSGTGTTGSASSVAQSSMGFMGSSDISGLGW